MVVRLSAFYFASAEKMIAVFWDADGVIFLYTDTRGTISMVSYIPGGSTLHSHCCENLRSKTVCFAFCCVTGGNYNVQL
jgi:hypothetical protein